MLRTLSVVVLSFLPFAAITADDKANQAATSPAARFKVLLEEYEEVEQPREFAGRFLELAEEHPQDPVAVEALIWIAGNVRRGAELERALSLLTMDYITDERLAALFPELTQKPSLATGKLLREGLEKSPHKGVQAQACVHLAASLREELRLMRSLVEQPDRRRFEQYYGKEYTAYLASLDEDEVTGEIEGLYKRVIESFGEVRTDDGTMGEMAEKELFAIRNLSLGKTAPEIEGKDIDEVGFNLSDYRGKVVVLSFWGHW